MCNREDVKSISASLLYKYPGSLSGRLVRDSLDEIRARKPYSEAPLRGTPVREVQGGCVKLARNVPGGAGAVFGEADRLIRRGPFLCGSHAVQSSSAGGPARRRSGHSSPPTPVRPSPPESLASIPRGRRTRYPDAAVCSRCPRTGSHAGTGSRCRARRSGA